MANTKAAKAQLRHSRTKTRSSRGNPAHSGDRFEDIGYFYDTIHGRVAFEELPPEFHPALKAAMASPTLDRLTRVSQLGHTSLTYFSATQTRFSHAVGTLLVMNRLALHLWPANLPPTVMEEVGGRFPKVYRLCHDKVTCIRCHLLLAALYQDCGELPFQKVTSLYFRPSPNELDTLSHKLPKTQPNTWKTKDVFTLRALCEDFEQTDLQYYDLGFLSFLIAGDGCERDSPLQMFRQMTDGTIDADRLDYVFRDALLTIGTDSRAETVLNSILRYEKDHVVVNDPRPAADFLATRARLWTFVYTSPDVRFRQALLRAFLEAGFSSEKGTKLFKDVGFTAEVTLPEFLQLDDHSMLQGIRAAKEHKNFSHLSGTGRKACESLLKTVTDYECRILSRPKPDAARSTPATLTNLPADLFFDLLLDHDEEHRLYQPKSVRVEQPLTHELGLPQKSVCLSECCGAIGPVFSKDNRAPLVRDAFFLFRPRQRGDEWNTVDRAIRQKTLYEAINREDALREIRNLDDTWDNRLHYKGRKTAISCSFEDRPTIVRIVRELQKQRQRYRILLDSLLGLGNTALDNSKDLIRDAEAVIVIASLAYLTSPEEKPGGNIDAEIRAIHGKNANAPKKETPVVVLSVDSYESLKSISTWRWTNLHPDWLSGPPILKGPLRYASETKLHDVVKAAIRYLNKGV